MTQPTGNSSPIAAVPDPCARSLQEGAGWRLGWDPTALVYPGLVGGDTWAMELTAAELADFCRLVQELAQTMTAMEPMVMAEERLSLEADSDRLYLAAEGFPQAYDLSLIVHHGRRAEGFWPAVAVPEILAAVQRLKLP